MNTTKEALHEGKKIILKRIKLIRLADRESWPVAAEYVSDDLASNSEDEKHINRAVRTANAKLEKRKRMRRQRTDTQKLNNNNNQQFLQSSSVPQNQLRYYFCNRVGHYAKNCLMANKGQVPIPQNTYQIGK